MPSFGPLPIEMINLIVSFITDRATILNCALVSSEWLSAARYYLFRDIEVNSAASYDLLVERVLRSHEHRKWFASTLSFRVESMRGRSGSMHAFLQDLGGQLPHLTRLLLDGMDWVAIEPNKLVTSWQFPALRELTLLDCVFPSFSSFQGALIALPLLHSLTLRDPIWPNQSHHTAVSSAHAQSLRLVYFDIRFNQSSRQMNQLFEWLLRVLSRDTMRVFRWVPVHSHDQPLDDIHITFLKALAPSVTTLGGASDCAPVAYFGGLQQLTIMMALYGGDVWQTAFPRLRNLSCRIRRLHFERVRTHVLPSPIQSSVDDARDLSSMPSEEDVVECDDLEGFEASLESDAYRDLEEVAFHLINWDRYGALLSLHEGQYEEEIQDMLPKLRARGIRITVFAADDLHCQYVNSTVLTPISPPASP